MVLFGWFDGCHVRLGRTFPVVKVQLRAATIVLSAALATGCAVGGYDSGALQRHLVAAGIPARQAACVVDRMGPRFGADRLSSRSRPFADELKAERALLKACGAKAGQA
jgi:hypothetical protein